MSRARTVREPEPLRDVPVDMGPLSSLVVVMNELQDMTDVLLGRVPPPVDYGVLTLQEVASAYYARAKEIEFQILRLELEKRVKRGDEIYRFRTGMLRSFIELADNSCDMGTRRVTMAKMETEGGG